MLLFFLSSNLSSNFLSPPHLNPRIISFIISKILFGNIVTNGGKVVDERFDSGLQDVGAELREPVVDEFLESFGDGAQVGEAGLDFGERLRAPLARRRRPVTLVLESLAKSLGVFRRDFGAVQRAQEQSLVSLRVFRGLDLAWEVGEKEGG